MQIIQSNLLKPFKNLTQGFTTKKNGNLAFHVGDNIENVTNYHVELSCNLGYDKNALVYMKQIHSNRVHIVNNSDDFNHPPICDALITNKINIPLMVMVADCTPIMFYDDVQKVIAVAHSGRAGTFSNIIQNVIDSFVNDFGSNLADIYVSIGASICQNCYEVGEEIYQEAKELKLNYAIEKKEEKYFLGIKKILKMQLLKAGIEHFEISDECNACLHDKYFSYRKEGVTGRFAGVISQSQTIGTRKSANYNNIIFSLVSKVVKSGDSLKGVI